MARGSRVSVRMLVAVVVALMVGGVGTSVASATTYYVVSGGSASLLNCQTAPSNINDPTTGCGLRAAINGVHSNDTVIIEPGPNALLAGTLTTPAGVTGVTIEGVDAQHPATITDSIAADTVAFKVGKGVTLRDLHVSYTPPGVVAFAEALEFSGDVAERVVARTSTGTACTLLNQGQDVLVMDTACVGSGDGVLALTNTSGSQNIQLENVTAVSTAASGANHGINVTEAALSTDLHVRAYNTIAWVNSGTGIHADAPDISSTVAVATFNSNYASTSVTNSRATITAIDRNVSHSQLTTPPVFTGSSTDPIAFDFHEATGSPTIAAGTAVKFVSGNFFPAGGSQDVDGDDRRHETADISFSTIDIGADQVPTAPTQRYAAVGGSTSAASCPSSAPCDLETAFEHAGPNDEVIVEPGRYDLGSHELFANFDVPLNFHGEAGKPRPVILSSSINYVLDLDSSQSTVRDVELDGRVSGLHLASQGTAERIIARSAGHACVLEERTTIRDSMCIATDSGSDAIEIYPDSTGFTMRNVTAISQGTGIYVSAITDMHATMANVIARGGPASAGGSGVWIQGASSDADLSISHSNYTSIKNSSGPTSDDGTNQTAAPVFVNPTGSPDAAGHEAYDFHEAAGSPTIGKGVVDPSTDPPSTDVDGQSRVSADGTIDIGGDQYYAPPPVVVPPPTGDHTAPALSRLLLKPVRFAVLAKGHRPKKGVSYKTSVSFSLSEPAVVRAVVQVKAMGRKVGTSCQKPSRKNRHARPCQLSGRLVHGLCQKQSAKNKTAPACKLWTTVGVAFSKSAKTGKTTVTFAGKVGTKALRPGSYRLALTATDPSKNASALKTVAFTIKKG